MPPAPGPNGQGPYQSPHSPVGTEYGPGEALFRAVQVCRAGFLPEGAAFKIPDSPPFILANATFPLLSRAFALL